MHFSGYQLSKIKLIGLAGDICDPVIRNKEKLNKIFQIKDIQT